MSGKRVLAVYAALLLGFMVVLCRLYLLAQHPAYAARAAAQSTVTLQMPARRGSFYDAQGQLLTGLEERWQVVCFPGRAITTGCMPARTPPGRRFCTAAAAALRRFCWR